MGMTVIGVDPHKHSHTAAVVDEHEEITAEVRVVADRRQVDRLLGWAARWPERLWAIENVNGLGRLLAQQLLVRGEVVVDVPAALSHRTRRLSGHSGRKTDAHDARSVAIAAANPTRLRRVESEDLAAVLGMILDRRRHLVTQRQRTICRVHALLAELSPGGAPRKLTLERAAVLLRTTRPDTFAGLQRRQIAKELLAEWRWLDRRLPPINQRLADTLDACDTTLTEIHGIATIGAATILAITGDVGRFPTAGHFAAFNGTVPLDASSGEVKRHRLNRGGNHALNSVLHIAAVAQISKPTKGQIFYRRSGPPSDRSLVDRRQGEGVQLLFAAGAPTAVAKWGRTERVTLPIWHRRDVQNRRSAQRIRPVTS
jgi:transposase